MKKSLLNKIPAMALTGIMLLGGFAGCAAQPGNTAGTTPTAAQTGTGNTGRGPDASSGTRITLQGKSALVEGAGASVSGGEVTITQGGVYMVDGALENGQITVYVTKNETVHLVLNGVDITNKSGAAVYAMQCEELIVTLAEGTQNTLTDGGANYVYADKSNKEPNAALFSKDDLTINGTGSLTVNAGFNNGIGTKDDLVIVQGNITVNAANHAIRGNDSVTVRDGSFTLTAGNDGIQTNEDEENASRGWMILQGGTFHITSAHDGIQAAAALTISGGVFDITAGGGGEKARTIASSNTTSDSYKGIKTAGDLTVSGGYFTIDSYDDSIHANGNVTIGGGDMILTTGDDGIHADGNLTISGGDIDVPRSYEGLEAANITISGGTVRLVSSDDGMNAAGGRDGSINGGRFGQDRFASGGNYSITISGGGVALSAGGDGLDSNGAINISGGQVVSIINSSADNQALDCDGTLHITGGEIIYGGTGTGRGFSSNSTQSYVFVGSSIAKGVEISIKKGGDTILTYTPDEDLRSLAFSCPGITGGESYDVVAASTLLDTVTAGTGGGGMGGGQRPGNPPGGRR